jgi:hypothetical protein
MIEPTADAAFVNGVLNHPEVRPWIADAGDGEIDLSDHLARSNVLALRGEHGLFMLYKLDVGLYEVHTAILPSGRGEWARKFGAEGTWFMFTRTDCIEILTRVPVPHAPARRLTLDMGFRHQFTTLPESRFMAEPAAIDVFSLSIQDWARVVPGIEEEGRAFHEWLNRQVREGQPHSDDPAHNRTVGIALSMIRAGMIGKGIVWYNRWAAMARHPMIALIETDPVRIRFDAGILTMADDGAISYSACH